MSNAAKVSFSNIAGSVYIGRPNGIEARKKFHLDQYDQEHIEVDVIFPERAKTISSSFFLGMFENSIRTLGSKEKFFNKYHFNDENHHIRKRVDQYVDKAIAALNSER